MKRILLTLVMVGIMANIVYAVEPIGEDVKSLVINSIKGYDRIIDVSIYQRGNKVMIILIADYGTSEQYARRMGGNLVRMLKSFSPDTSPNNRIGPGIYEYHVKVTMPSQTMLAEGVKFDIGHNLKWL